MKTIMQRVLAQRARKYQENNPITYRVSKFFSLYKGDPTLPKREELTQFFKDHWHKPCKYCTMPSTSLDHIVPLSRGGTHEMGNLQLICVMCNTAKLDYPEEIFLHWITLLCSNRYNSI